MSSRVCPTGKKFTLISSINKNALIVSSEELRLTQAILIQIKAEMPKQSDL